MGKSQKLEHLIVTLWQATVLLHPRQQIESLAGTRVPGLFKQLSFTQHITSGAKPVGFSNHLIKGVGE